VCFPGAAVAQTKINTRVARVQQTYGHAIREENGDWLIVYARYSYAQRSMLLPRSIR
jgi:hypothetical protein